MSKFEIRYASGRTAEYSVQFTPWPTFGMLYALALAMLREKGGKAVEFKGPNGLYGFVTAEKAGC